MLELSQKNTVRFADSIPFGKNPSGLIDTPNEIIHLFTLFLPTLNDLMQWKNSCRFLYHAVSIDTWMKWTAPENIVSMLKTAKTVKQWESPEKKLESTDKLFEFLFKRLANNEECFNHEQGIEVLSLL